MRENETDALMETDDQTNVELSCVCIQTRDAELGIRILQKTEWNANTRKSSLDQKTILAETFVCFLQIGVLAITNKTKSKIIKTTFTL